ncbi:MAG: TRAP transporter small permease [Burkholderiaceae bacterium]
MNPGKGPGPASAGPLFDRLALAVRVATAVVLAALVIIVCTEAFLRGVANVSLDYVEELTGYFVVTLTFFGAALALRASALFRVSFLFDAMPAPARRWLSRVFIAGALFVCAILAWRSTDLVLSSFSRGKFAPTELHTPLWIPQLIMPVGFVLLGVFLIEQWLLSARATKAGE